MCDACCRCEWCHCHSRFAFFIRSIYFLNVGERVFQSVCLAACRKIKTIQQSWLRCEMKFCGFCGCCGFISTISWEISRDRSTFASLHVWSGLKAFNYLLLNQPYTHHFSDDYFFSKPIWHLSNLVLLQISTTSSKKENKIFSKINLSTLNWMTTKFLKRRKLIVKFNDILDASSAQIHTLDTPNHGQAKWSICLV